MKNANPPVVLPQNILKCMSPGDRAVMGKAGMTAEEAQAKVEARGEKELQRQVGCLLRLRGIWYSQPAMHKRNTLRAGTPDFMFALFGMACAFECKVNADKPRPEQEQTHAEMRRNGWDVRVIYTLAAAKQVLDYYYSQEKL